MNLPQHHPKYGELIAINPAKKRGLYSKMEWDGNAFNEALTSVYETDTLLDQNNDEQIENQNKRYGELQKIASVPYATLEQSGLNRAFIEGDDKFIRRFLNDSDNEKLRTFRGRV
jgi:hypothetical protein